MLSLADLSLIENAQGTEPFTMIDNLLAPAPGDVPSIGGPSNDDASSCDTEDIESTDGAASCEDAAEAKQITPRNSNSDDEMDEDEWPEGVPRIEMPKLSSNLAQVCSLSVSIQEAVESRWLGPPPPGPVLQSELGKRCELQVRVPLRARPRVSLAHSSSFCVLRRRSRSPRRPSRPSTGSRRHRRHRRRARAICCRTRPSC